LQTAFNTEVTIAPLACEGTTSCVGAAAHTFVPNSSFKLDKFTIRLAGGPTTGAIYLFPEPVGGTNADGYVNVGFSTSLLNGGAGLPFTFNGTATRTLMEFDLTGSDEITLSAGTKYAIDIRNIGYPSSVQSMYWMRGGTNLYTPGNIYATGSGTQPSERYDVGPDRRDGALAIYGAVVVGVSGDYNNNGTVDAADYVLWRQGGPLTNDPTLGVQPADYDFWRSRFGATSGAGVGLGVAAAVPEPAMWLLLLTAGCWLGRGRLRK
jgi:hypothetical protein